MNSAPRKFRSNSFKPPVGAPRNAVISSQGTGRTLHTPNTKPKPPSDDTDIDKLSNALFKGLQNAFDDNSDIRANDYDLLNGISHYESTEPSSNTSMLSTTKSKTERSNDTEKYKAVAEYAKNRVAKFKEENPKAYMRFKYHKNNEDAGPFGLTTLNYEGETYEKPSEHSALEEEDKLDMDDDPDDFLKMETSTYSKKPGGASDDLEELRKMIKQMDSMIGSYKKQTISLTKSVKDLNSHAVTAGMGVKEDVFDRIDSTLQEIEMIRKMSSMKGPGIAWTQTSVKGALPNKSGLSPIKPSGMTGNNFAKPPGGMIPKISLKNKNA